MSSSGVGVADAMPTGESPLWPRGVPAWCIFRSPRRPSPGPVRNSGGLSQRIAPVGDFYTHRKREKAGAAAFSVPIAFYGKTGRFPRLVPADPAKTATDRSLLTPVGNLSVT